MDAIVDNDILFKAASFGLFDELVLTNCQSDGSVGILGAARYLVPKKIHRNIDAQMVDAASAAFQTFLAVAKIVEPTHDEQVMAADFELAAQRAAVALDSGESQLCAVLIARALPLLLTGDKRAIVALEQLIEIDNRLSALEGKVRCLEQLILLALSASNYAQFRAAVCRQPGVDKALAICFSCTLEQAALEGITEGLKSHINNLRSHANRILSP